MTGDAVVLVPLPDGRALALERDAYLEALERGQELLPTGNGSAAAGGDGVPEIRDAGGMEALTSVPASWWLEAARRGDVPSIQAGTYRRFRVDEALEALKRR